MRVCRVSENLRVGLNLGEICHEVHLVGLDNWLAAVKLGTHIQEREEHQRQIVGYKCISLPLSFEEHFPSAELRDDISK